MNKIVIKNQIWILVLLLLVCSVLLAVIWGCGKTEKIGWATGVVSVTGNFQAGIASLSSSGSKILAVKSSALGPHDRVSFTPSSMKIRVRGMSLGTQCIYSADAGGLTIDKAGNEINLLGSPQEIELIGQNAFGNLYTFTTAEVEESKFGNYRGVLLLYGQDVPPGQRGSAEVVISGTLEVGGTTYTFNNLAVPMGSSGIGLNMPSSFAIAEGTTTVVKALFDVENCPYLSKSGSSPNSAQIPGTDVYVTIENLPFLPYAGVGDPTMEKYNVTLEASAFGSPQTWYLRVVIFKDSSGELAAVQWYTVYKDGFSSSSAFEPGMISISSFTKNSDGSYYLKGDEPAELVPPSRKLEFPAFKLESHTGILNYGGASYSYTATKQ